MEIETLKKLVDGTSGIILSTNVRKNSVRFVVRGGEHEGVSCYVEGLPFVERQIEELGYTVETKFFNRNVHIIVKGA